MCVEPIDLAVSLIYISGIGVPKRSLQSKLASGRSMDLA